jgi:UDP-2,3-diacylglucosamine hydrolase
VYRKIYSVSDLHLFCRRSLAERHMLSIADAVADADAFVFNGDIFDFRWSVLPSAAETAREAVRWLERTVRSRPECQFHYVLGNHDHVQVFIDRLHELTERTPNLSWDPYYLQIGNALFLHGDCVVGRMTARDLETFRHGWLEEESRGEWVNALYDMAFRTRVHCAVSRMFFPRAAVISRLAHYLDDIGHGAGSDTKSVYFGHTHLAIDGLEHRGQRFYNGGAPMPGLAFKILRAKVPA